MGRQIYIPLLKWRQGAEQRFISQITWAINPMTLNCTRFAIFNPLFFLLINWLGAGSIAVVWVLGLIAIKPAQANPSEPQATPLEPSHSTHLTDVAKPRNQNSEALAQQVAAVPSSQPQVSQPVVVPPNSIPVVKEHSVSLGSSLSPVRLSTDSGATLKVEGLTALPGLAATKGTSNLDFGLLTPTSQSECPSGTTCSASIRSVTPIGSPNLSNKTLAQLPSLPQPLPVPATPIPVGSNRSNTTLGQLPDLPQPLSPVPNPTGFPASSNSYNPMVGQSPYYQQPMILVPMMGAPSPGGVNGYNPMVGQSPYYQQPMILVPMMGAPSPGGVNGYNPIPGQSPYVPQIVPVTAPAGVGGGNGYNPIAGQSPYYPQTVPITATGSPGGVNGYNPMPGQSPYYLQPVPALPAPLTPNPVGVNGYNPMAGQSPYYPQTVPITATGSPGGVNGYNPMAGQSPYYPQTVPITAAPSAGGVNGYNPMAGQSPYYPQTVPPLPAPLTQTPVGSGNYNPALGQTPSFPQSTPPLPYAPNPTLTPSAPTPLAPPAPTPLAPPAPTSTTPPAPTQQPSLLRSSALTAPYLGFQGTYINQGDESAARARLTGLYPLNPRVQFGGSLDLITGDNIFSDSRGQGLNINELYISAAPFADLPNLRLVAGQLDLTSYFDRNSFAKDGATHFFNSVFQTNPALSATGISSRPGVLVNWTVTDNIEAKAAVFSSSRSLGDFSLDGFAGEIGLRYGNGIIRGTYATVRDAGSRDAFQELFQVDRGGGRTGPLGDDREEAYGVNAEYFFPQLNMGIFGRYGRYENQALNLGGNTYSFGISFLDLILKDDRLGLAYGRGLSNEQLRREFEESLPDVLELFYDVRIFPNLRLGVTLQERNGFSELYGGFRVKTEFDITPIGRSAP